MCEAEIILSDNLIFTLLYIFSLEFTVFVDDIVQRVDIHIGAESDEDVAHHFIDFDCGLDGGDAVGVDGIGDIEMKKIEFFLSFIERGLDEGGIGE